MSRERGKGREIDAASEKAREALERVQWRECKGPPGGVDPEGLPWVTHEGLLDMGLARVRVYMLSNGLRVIDEDDFAAVLGSLGRSAQA